MIFVCRVTVLDDFTRQTKVIEYRYSMIFVCGVLVLDGIRASITSTAFAMFNVYHFQVVYLVFLVINMIIILVSFHRDPFIQHNKTKYRSDVLEIMTLCYVCGLAMEEFPQVGYISD